MEKTNKILNYHIGRDCAGIVMSMVFAKCCRCKKLEYDYYCIENFEGKFVCGECYIKYEYYDCIRCNKVYSADLFNWCSRCFDNCYMFCPIHLKDKYKIFVFKDIYCILALINEDELYDNTYY